MKAFKIIIAIVIIIPVLFFVVGNQLPKSTRVERSIEIGATAGAVFSLIGDFHEFERWNPWSKKDPAIKVEYSGPKFGLGAARHWSGNRDVGSGSMTIVEYEPHSKVVMTLDFGSLGGGEAHYDIVDNDNSSTVTWSFITQHSNILQRYFGLMMDGVLGQDYENGLASLKTTAESLAPIKTEEVSYTYDGVTLTGYIAYPIGLLDKVPAVLVVHEWWGHNDYARKRAEMLAHEGYVGFAIDMYGDGKLASHPKDAQAFRAEVGVNTELTAARFDAAFKVVSQHHAADPARIAAIGYCFGGSVVLNMARMGKHLKGVASFHGGLGDLSPITGPVITPMLVMNGADDPFITEEQKLAFKAEMNLAGLAYEFIDYPGAQHSFTNPDADKYGEEFSLPLKYNKEVDEASWEELKNFLARVLFL